MTTGSGGSGAAPHGPGRPVATREAAVGRGDVLGAARRTGARRAAGRPGPATKGGVLEPRAGGPGRRLGERLGGVHRAAPVLVVGLSGYAVLTLAMLGLGFLVVEFGVDSWVGDADRQVARWLARRRTFPFDGLTSVFSAWADTWTVVMAALGTGAVLLACRCWRQAVVLAVGLPLELAVFLSVTYLVGRRRPAVPKPDSVPATASFPSGHVTAAVVLYGGLALIVWSLTRSSRVHALAATAAVALALAVGGARVYRGLHYPTDAVAGAGLGTACLVVAVLAARSLPLDRPPEEEPPPHDDGAARRRRRSDRHRGAVPWHE